MKLREFLEPFCDGVPFVLVLIDGELIFKAKTNVGLMKEKEKSYMDDEVLSLYTRGDTIHIELVPKEQVEKSGVRL